MPHSNANRAPADPPAPLTGFDDGVDESALLDMISGIESRLGDLRDATLSIPAHDEPQASESGDRIIETVQNPEHGVSQARREELDRRERDVAEREQLLLAQTERIDHEVHQLEQARKLLTEQNETHRERTESAKAARGDIDRRTEELDRRAGELDQREAQIKGLEDEIESKSNALDAQKAELDELRDALTQQQQDMERDSEQYAQLQGDMAALFERLSEAEAHAIQNATSTDASPELESRWRSLEQECTRLKRELSTTRKTLRETESRQKAEIADPAPAPLAISHRGRARAVLAAGWLVGGAILALATLLGMLAEMPTVGVSLLGGVFAAYFVTASQVAKRLVTPSTIAFTLLAATFGLWIPIWTDGLREALMLWDVPLSFLPVPLHATAPQAIAILTSGMVMAMAIYLVTSSGANFGAAFTATLVATPIAMIPIEPVPLVVAAILWNAIIAAALTRWALNSTDEDLPGIAAAPSLANVPRRPTV